MFHAQRKSLKLPGKVFLFRLLFNLEVNQVETTPFHMLTLEQQEERCLKLEKEVALLRQNLLKQPPLNDQGDARPRNRMSTDRKSEGPLFRNAVAKIRESQFEISDQRYMLENLCSLIASGRMDTKSHAF